MLELQEIPIEKTYNCNVIFARMISGLVSQVSLAEESVTGTCALNVLLQKYGTVINSGVRTATLSDAERLVSKNKG